MKISEVAAAAVLRARALIDAGVAVADIHRPDAVERSIGMLRARTAERPADVLLARGYPGDGVVDFAALTAAVARAGYAGDIEVEIFNADVWSADPRGVVETMKQRYRELVLPGLSA